MIRRLLNTEPVRVYGIASAAIPVLAYFVPSGAWPLLVGLVAAVLGVGEVTRARVFSPETHERELDHLVTIAAAIDESPPGLSS